MQEVPPEKEIRLIRRFYMTGTTIHSTRNLRAVVLFIVFYVCFGAYLSLMQERFIYLPGSQDFYVCHALSHAETVLHGDTRMYVTRGERGTVVLYHGNAGSACDRAWYEEIAAEAGFGMIIPEYAGYSNDTVTPSHARIQQNVQDVIAYLALHDIAPVYLIGESIGTGVASYHTSRMPPEKLFLISPFTTLPDVAQTHYWYYPTRLLVQNPFDTRILLYAYEGHVTILHATHDTVIPISLGRAVYEAIPHQHKTFVEVPTADHNDLWDHPPSLKSLRDFFNSPLAPRSE